MKKLEQKGFTIIEIAITLSAILIIIAMSSGVYFGIISKSQEAAIIKTATDDLPKAILAYYMDTGTLPFKCDDTAGGAGTYLWGLNNRDKALYPSSDRSKDAAVQAKWRGPYLKTGALFSSTGNLVDDNLSDVYYCFKTSAAIVGRFGRLEAKGWDYTIQIRMLPPELAAGIHSRLGANKTLLSTMDDGSNLYKVEYVFYKNFSDLEQLTP
jgi:prepilin-type N-terminal cleavage/methylation domain-containing protein